MAVSQDQSVENGLRLQCPTWAPEQSVTLPAPTKEGRDPVIALFAQRRTIRDISCASLPKQLLSDLLWSAFGINRGVGPFGVSGRTAASASNSQEIDLYVADAEGISLYDPYGHHLVPIVRGDLRAAALTPGQTRGGSQAPVELVYVVDLQRLMHTSGFQEPGLQDPEVQKSYYYLDTGLIAGNVYLFSAAKGLATWFHNCDKVSLAQHLHLGASQRVLFAQSVGFAATA